MLSDELRTKWVEALLSRKYLQAREQLCNGEGYCCLGVLCDVINPEGWDDEHELWYTDPNWRDYEWSDDDYEQGPVALDVEFSPGFRDSIGMDDKHHKELISLNDDKLATFEQIASFIVMDKV